MSLGSYINGLGQGIVSVVSGVGTKLTEGTTVANDEVAMQISKADETKTIIKYFLVIIIILALTVIIIKK